MSIKRLIKQLNSIEKLITYSKCGTEYEKVDQNKTLKSLLYNLNHPRSFQKRNFLKELAKKYPYQVDELYPNQNVLSFLQATREYQPESRKEQTYTDKKPRIDSYTNIFNLTCDRIKKKKKEWILDSFLYNPKYNVIDKNIPSARICNPTYRDEIIKSKKNIDLSKNKKSFENTFKESHKTLENNTQYRSFKVLKKINDKNDKYKIFKNINEIQRMSNKEHIKFKSNGSLRCNTDGCYINKILSDLTSIKNKNTKIKINDNIKNIFHKKKNEKISEHTRSNLFTKTYSGTTEKDSNNDNSNKIINDGYNINIDKNKFDKKQKKITKKKYNKYYKVYDKTKVCDFSKMTPRKESDNLKINMLNNPSSTYYTPKYNCVFERTKITFFGNHKKSVLSRKKYLMKKLWGSYSNIGQNYYIVDNNKIDAS